MSPVLSISSKRELILSLYQSGKRNCQIFRELKNMKVNSRLIERTTARYRKTYTIVPVHKGGRKRSVRTKEAIKAAREAIRRNPARSGRQLAKERNIQYSSMQRILKKCWDSERKATITWIIRSTEKKPE